MNFLIQAWKIVGVIGGGTSFYVGTMGSMMLSVETLFWAPLAMDVMLLVGTYSACNLKGLGWFLDEMKKHSVKKNDDNDDEVIAKLVEDKSHPIHSVWYIAMSAYSAYACVSRHVSIIVSSGISVSSHFSSCFYPHSCCHGQRTLPTRIRIFVSPCPGR